MKFTPSKYGKISHFDDRLQSAKYFYLKQQNAPTKTVLRLVAG